MTPSAQDLLSDAARYAQQGDPYGWLRALRMLVNYWPSTPLPAITPSFRQRLLLDLPNRTDLSAGPGPAQDLYFRGVRLQVIDGE